jgi:hypothetical protein
LIVSDGDTRFYIFKRYTLHPLIDPTATQQAYAQRVSGDFLAHYAQGKPVDRYGYSVNLTPQVKSASPLPKQPTALHSSRLVSYLGQWFGGMLALIGSLWLLARLIRAE